MAQDLELVSGKVIDNDGEPLPGVSILIKGTTVGTTSDFEGNYKLEVSSTAILQFSFIGFQTKEIEVNSQSEINVQLEPDLEQLDEVVVIGYGTQSRETLTTSISKLDNKVLENIPYTNAASALQGTISGVRVQNTSGQPGQAPRIILRGGTSINNPNGSTPLYIIDGVFRSQMDDVNPDDIETIQVLKDAAATAIYGSRASNGVVIITTKTGESGKTRISYKFNLGYSELQKKYDLASARDYIYFNRLGLAATGEKHPERLSRLDLATGSGIGNDLTNNTAFTTQYLTPENEYKLREGWESMPDPLDPSKTIIFKDTDWQNVLFRTGVTQNHYLSATGGGEKATFDLGLGYLKSEGVAIYTGYERFTGRLNADLRIKDNVSVIGKINFTNSSNNQVYSENQLFQRALGLPPTAKYTYEDGTLAPGQNRSLGNPAYHLDKLQAFNNTNRLTMSVGGNWDIIKNLSFEPLVSLYAVQGIENFFQEGYYNTATQFVDSRNASASHSSYWQKQFDGVFTYSPDFKSGHNLQLKAGAMYQDRKNYSLSATGRGAATDNVPTLNASAEPTSVYSYTSQFRTIGFFGRVLYDFDQKYLLSANLRYDGASNLGDNNKWGVFPGVSVGWNLHRENFWDNLPEQFSRFKLRTSYGINGNLSDLNDFHAQGAYTAGVRYNGVAGIQNNRMANKDLQWEESRTFDVGVDFGIFNNRVTAIFDYYRRVTDNLLTNLDLPYSTGFTSILTNLGSLENKGIELEIGANIIETQNGFSWSISFNTAKNKNKILKLPENDNPNNRIGGINVYDPVTGSYVWKGGLQEGQTLGELYAYQYEKVYSTDQEANEGPVDMLVAGTDKSKFGGDVQWMDLDANDTIDTRDRVYTGNIYPKWTGGFSNTFSYKGLSLLVRMDYALGHTIYNLTRATFNGQFQGDIGITNDVLRSWQKQGDETDIPRYYWADQLAQNNSFRGSSYYHEKGDYLALREVTLSYQVPKLPSLKKIGITNLRIYATGSNLHYFTKYKGLLPEDGGTDYGRYPYPKTITFGLNASF
ncbi:SusC/RagA family TonB-linked outer membrane protein [Flexithrix dorotheae]|uniref:SusC/RagA family TonB-linked outer membrane protein n=1 Tax=Flexithrix dorotheae TaxID=70993 RepID=UPI00035DA461|nr:TonB-dependent receptor [Flexithrix dorotheae]